MLAVVALVAILPCHTIPAVPTNPVMFRLKALGEPPDVKGIVPKIRSPLGDDTLPTASSPSTVTSRPTLTHEHAALLSEIVPDVLQVSVAVKLPDAYGDAAARW